MKRNFKNTVMFFSRLVGLNHDCADQLKEEERYVTYPIVQLDNKKIGVEFEHRGQKYVFSPEQLMASFLTKIHKFFNVAEIFEKDIVISCPSYWCNAER
jgi:molecular chaperone DnaK (HSP70)